MLLSPTNNGLTSLFKEVRAFKAWGPSSQGSDPSSVLDLRTLFPLTAFKNARNPKFVQICPSDFFRGFQSGGLKFGKICQNLKNGNFRTVLTKSSKFQSPWLEPPKKRWKKFWTNLGFRAFLNAVRGKRARNLRPSMNTILATSMSAWLCLGLSLRDSKVPQRTCSRFCRTFRWTFWRDLLRNLYFYWVVPSTCSEISFLRFIDLLALWFCFGPRALIP